MKKAEKQLVIYQVSGGAIVSELGRESGTHTL